MPWLPANAYKRICFTINLPDGKTHGDYDLDLLRNRLNPDFMICGRETGGATKRAHFQGYLEFPKKLKGSTIDKHFRFYFPLPISCHYEPAMGNAQQNIDYCSKEDKDPFKFGEPGGGQGSRTDLGEMFKAVKEGADDVALIAQDAGKWAVHRRALQEYRMMCAPKRDFPSKLIFLYGPTGTGKTMHAQELEPETVIYRDPFMTGYTGAKANVLFDDFNWRKMDPKYWLTLCDRYSMTVETKGGQLNWAPKIIIFTSNDDPREWWPEAPEATKQAIWRRMDEFGEAKLLGQLVPKDQLLLKDYFTAKPVAPSSTSSAAGGGVRASSLATTDVVDLTQDSSDDEEQQPKLGKRRGRDWDEHSMHSNVAYADDRDCWPELEEAAAPGCKYTDRCTTRVCYCT